MKEIYILATESGEPIGLEGLQEAYESENVELAEGQGGLLFSITSDQVRVEVRFEQREAGLGWAPHLITGTEPARAALKSAKGFYRISFEPGRPQPSVAVFEALWCARAILELEPGVLLDVTSFKLHTVEDVAELTELDFDIRDHLNLHAVEAAQTETPVWVHSHGMAKFGMRDVEVFHLGEADLRAAEAFFHELCTDLAFGHGPQARQMVHTSAGASFMLLPSEEGRLNLFGVEPETFEGHEGLYWTVVGPDSRHSLAELLKPYRDRFESESEEEGSELLRQAQELLPAFKARFQRKGLMEPLTFLVRAPFESHPHEETVQENLWAEILTWEDDSLLGKLRDGGQLTTEWRKGSQVEISDDQINAIALSREGRSLEVEEMRALLLAEKPM